jgi:hypothetical protein
MGFNSAFKGLKDNLQPTNNERLVIVPVKKDSKRIKYG